MTHDPLISSALLGTARSATLPPAPDESLQKTWDLLAGDPADKLLQALALTRALHRGGRKLQIEEQIPPVCAPESRKLLSPTAVDALMRLLKGEFLEVLPEWLGFATASDRVLPGRVLPELLAMAGKDRSLRPAVRQLAGERGRWIAARYVEHAWITENQYVTDVSWDDGSPAERVSWLRQTRAADPSCALDSVISHWPGEDAAMREAILRVILENPLPGDESWLEQHVLNDRRQEIRELAAACLACIPNSAFRARSHERLRTYVKTQRRLLKRVITVEPPTAFDPTWAADGVKEKAPQGTGEKAWWLRQMIAAVPLDEWPGLLGCGAGDLFGFTIDEDWRELLLLGWIDAARRVPQRALADWFVPFLATLEPWPVAALPKTGVLASLLEALSSAGRFTLLDQIVEKLPVPSVLDLLVRCREAPPAGQGKAVLTVIDAALASSPTIFNRSQARALALCIPQDGIRQRLELLAKLPELSAAAEEFAITLEFRRSLPTYFDP